MDWGGKGDYLLRIYDKTKEIKTFKHKSFAKTHLWQNNKNYNPDLKVWRLEIQIRRAKLKKMVNSNGNTMDNYHNCLNGIPDLWSKALEDYEIKDVPRDKTSDLFHGDRVQKNGKTVLLTKHSITKIFKRSPSLYFWEKLKTWNHNDRFNKDIKKITWTTKNINITPLYYFDYLKQFGYLPISTAPKTPNHGSQEYVNNSIKSLYSTLAKHKGSVTKKTLIEAFKIANEDSIKRNDVSLLEDSFNKQLDWMELVDGHVHSGVLNTPDYKSLETEIVNVISTCDNHIKNVLYSEDILLRIEARMHSLKHTPDKVIYKDLDYLDSMTTRLEARLAFHPMEYNHAFR